MRLFIAVDIPENVKDALSEIKKPLLKKYGMKFVSRGNEHITLKFLGEVSDERVPRIIQEISEIKFPSFMMHLEKIGAFPTEKQANVFWVSAEPQDRLLRVKQQIDKLLPKIPDEKPFKSHITLARCDAVDLRDEIEHLALHLQKAEFLVSKITLYKSTLTPSGPVYEKLA